MHYVLLCLENTPCFTQTTLLQDALRAVFETFSTPLIEQLQKISTVNPKGTS